jgi:anti-sigma-K factor RskA
VDRESVELRMSRERWRVIAVTAIVVAVALAVALFAVNASRRAERIEHRKAQGER